jgi:hypothetical protein
MRVDGLLPSSWIKMKAGKRRKKENITEALRVALKAPGWSHATLNQFSSLMQSTTHSMAVT